MSCQPNQPTSPPPQPPRKLPRQRGRNSRMLILSLRHQRASDAASAQHTTSTSSSGLGNNQSSLYEAAIRRTGYNVLLNLGDAAAASTAKAACLSKQQPTTSPTPLPPPPPPVIASAKRSRRSIEDGLRELLVVEPGQINLFITIVRRNSTHTHTLIQRAA